MVSCFYVFQLGIFQGYHKPEVLSYGHIWYLPGINFCESDSRDILRYPKTPKVVLGVGFPVAARAPVCSLIIRGHIHTAADSNDPGPDTSHTVTELRLYQGRQCLVGNALSW